MPSRYPPVDLFERVADPSDWEALFAIEAFTNSRLRDQAGDISLVPPEHRVSGPGASYIMAPFTHLSGLGGRFSTNAFGAYYTSRELETAIRETVYHRERFLSATREPPIELDMLELRATLKGELHDIRGLGPSQPALYDPSSYGASQAFAAELRGKGSAGIVYDSLRSRDGQCAAVFIPKLVSDCKRGRRYAYVWDGARIASVYEKSAWRAV